MISRNSQLFLENRQQKIQNKCELGDRSTSWTLGLWNNWQVQRRIFRRSLVTRTSDVCQINYLSPHPTVGLWGPNRHRKQNFRDHLVRFISLVVILYEIQIKVWWNKKIITNFLITGLHFGDQGNPTHFVSFPILSAADFDK